MLCSSSIERTSQHESSSIPVYSQQQISIDKACPKYLNEVEALKKHGRLNAASGMLLFSTEYAYL